jgi:hypothetical protein
MTDNEKKIDFQHETVLKNEAIDGLGLVDGGV